MSFIVQHPGMLTLIQDAGRFGQHNIGLTHGGPIDLLAYQWANRLCGNDKTPSLQVNNPSHSVLEISIGGLILEAQVDSKIAITGANMPLSINGQARELWRSHSVKVSDIIALGYANPSQGCRSYLAVEGGFNIPLIFGSSATVCREKIGGLNGGKLQKGDCLPCHSLSHSNGLVKGNNRYLKAQDQPMYSDHVLLRTVPSYQQQHFSSLQQRLFYSCEYSVSAHYDRMGYRLAGQTIKADVQGILSEGICHGAVQIPADGQPIVLLNDRQTIGGYPKIGSVISLDSAKLGQLSQGGKVHFEAISMETAHNLQHLAASHFQRCQLVNCH